MFFLFSVLPYGFLFYLNPISVFLYKYGFPRMADAFLSVLRFPSWDTLYNVNGYADKVACEPNLWVWIEL